METESRAGVNLRGLREHNQALLLGEIRRAGGLSRIELAERSGLTQQAVSKIVPALLDAGILDEEREPSRGVGKPRIRLRIRPDARHALGAQLDRDELRVVRTDLLGAVVAEQTRDLPAGFTPDDAIGALKSCVDDLRGDTLLGLGVGALGPLDHTTGVLREATNLPGWHEVPLRDLLTEATGLPVLVDKDTNAAAAGYAWHATTPARAAAVVLVGTGIGAGLLIDGKVYRGPRTNAGEFGHTTIAHDGPRCPCGRRGCIEVLHNAAVRRGDPGEAARLLGVGLVDLVQLLDLEQLVLSVRARPELYRAQIDAQLSASLPLPGWQKLDLILAEHDDRLVAAGAATEVLARFYADPST
ncbi:ROK family transcriptional regulator [Amycolatopsis magusensis]|uniref:ROK family transcriptional regulator n=1 Tax=Amycolatopsis magusensis TaxID=882444 RepID=UPI003C2B98CE